MWSINTKWLPPCFIVLTGFLIHVCLKTNHSPPLQNENQSLDKEEIWIYAAEVDCKDMHGDMFHSSPVKSVFI